MIAYNGALLAGAVVVPTNPLYVVLKAGQSATEREIVGFCRERMAAYKVPKTVEFRPELPKSMIGKVLRRALREEEAAARRASQVKEVV